MARYALLIARALVAKYPEEITDEMAEQIYLFAPLHDVGKIGIPDDVLLKPGKLDPDERLIMETHVARGVEIVDRIIQRLKAEQLPNTQILRNIVRCHHEFLDGSGYPRGLKNSDIPIEARIVTVADIFDALTSERPYKEALSLTASFAVLDRMVADGKIDVRCVDELKHHQDEVLKIRSTHRDQRESEISIH